MESENNPPNEPGLVTVFRLAGGGTEEMEVLTVRQLLESNGINTVLVGDSPMPNLSEEIRVAEEDAERALGVDGDHGLELRRIRRRARSFPSRANTSGR